MYKQFVAKLMLQAFLEARRAFVEGEVPVGAIVVDRGGEIVGRGRNMIVEKGSQLWHAEVVAIDQASQSYGDWRLEGASLYVTLEPCLMCTGLIQLSRIEKVYYAAKSELFGASNFVTPGAMRSGSSGIFEFVGGPFETYSAFLLRAFFTELRLKTKKEKSVEGRKKFLDSIRTMLLQKKREIEEQVSVINSDLRSDGEVHDLGDEMQNIYMKKLGGSLQEAEINEIREIDDAIKRIERGEYGICVDCGCEISELRLKNYPFAARCINCQERLEGSGVN
jgi:tRNA(adenine34) deaminase